MLRNTLSARTLLASLLTVSVATASAVEIYNPQGFEAPLFSQGDIHLQDGWLAFIPPAASAEIVSSSHPSGGEQMVRFTHREGGDAAFAVKELYYGLQPDSVVSLSFDMRLDESWFAGLDSDSSYLAGVTIDFDTAAGLVPAILAAGVFGDEFASPLAGKSGFMMADGSFVEHELDSGWHKIGLTYDNTTGALVGTFDNVVLLTSYIEPGSVTEATNIAFASERYWGGQDTAYADFDELSVAVTPSAVPEPSTVIALGLSALALMRRQRKPNS